MDKKGPSVKGAYSARWRCLVFLLLSAIAADARSFDARGHEYVGAIADQLLGPGATRQVAQLIGMPLQVAATWADCVKSVSAEVCKAFESPQGIRRMEDYVRRNPNHRQYHYADVAFQHGRYDRAYRGTSDHDIVSAINAAIAVLQGRPAPAPFKIADKQEALLMLAHFVGDLHQPLHVGAIYLGKNGQPIDPDAIGGKLARAGDTHGGNAIDVGKKNLHSEWDAVPKSLNPLKIVRATLGKARDEEAAGGDVGTWAAQWASETVLVSREAYRGMTFTPSLEKKTHWVAHFDDRRAYLKAKSTLETEQLTKAGARLAQALNAIWP